MVVSYREGEKKVENPINSAFWKYIEGIISTPSHHNGILISNFPKCGDGSWANSYKCWTEIYSCQYDDETGLTDWKSWKLTVFPFNPMVYSDGDKESFSFYNKKSNQFQQKFSTFTISNKLFLKNDNIDIDYAWLKSIFVLQALHSTAVPLFWV